MIFEFSRIITFMLTRKIFFVFYEIDSYFYKGVIANRFISPCALTLADPTENISPFFGILHLVGTFVRRSHF
jgi:hypothetical protein